MECCVGGTSRNQKVRSKLLTIYGCQANNQSDKLCFLPLRAVDRSAIVLN